MIQESTPTHNHLLPFDPKTDRIFYIELDGTHGPSSPQLKGKQAIHYFSWQKAWGAPRRVKNPRAGVGEANIMMTFEELAEVTNDLFAGLARGSLRLIPRIGMAGMVKNRNRKAPLKTNQRYSFANIKPLPITHEIKDQKPETGRSDSTLDEANGKVPQKESSTSPIGTETDKGGQNVHHEAPAQSEAGPGGTGAEVDPGVGIGATGIAVEGATLQGADQSTGDAKPNEGLPQVQQNPVTDENHRDDTTGRGEGASDSTPDTGGDASGAPKLSDSDQARLFRDKVLSFDDLAGLNPAQLKELAKARGMKGVFTAKHETLIKAHTKWQGENLK